MNLAFKKGKLANYYGSGFYIGQCRNTNLTYSKSLSMQSNKLQNNILGEDNAELFRSSAVFHSPPFHPNFRCSYTLICVEEEL